MRRLAIAGMPLPLVACLALPQAQTGSPQQARLAADTQLGDADTMAAAAGFVGASLLYRTASSAACGPASTSSRDI
jgi:hypothetical protein